MKKLRDFLTEEEELSVLEQVNLAVKEIGGTLLFLGVSGSYLHGTADAQSDVDFKAWYQPSCSDILSSRACQTVKLELEEADLEVEVKPITSFTECIEKTDTNLIDTLYTPETYVLYSSELWYKLSAQRKYALSTSLTGMMEYMETHCADYDRKISAMRELQAIMDTFNRDAKYVRDAFDLDRFVEEGLVDIVDKGKFAKVRFKDKQFNLNAPAEQFFYGIEKKFNGYGNRMKLTERNGYDAKALGHIYRVAFQCLDIAENSHLSLPLEENLAKKILEIKRSEMTQDLLDELERTIEDVRQCVKNIMAKSDLPEKPNAKLFEGIIVNHIFAKESLSAFNHYIASV
ncbi:hypothetical protein [Vibrio phage vB_VmeM-Yong XC32]|nr:hypothetical protein [Vibrio phage vB_VmeM-Yong XC31]QAX96585.1 hypothetical protein [Vibrio phage vB_VmeM-Yong XC32]QAX96903.1 hypothetical protein [Vibrio phage vB_VmeM-Yong MS31]QAX97208.1 hypothetical protein [Vibrio phage vB_VmeM-Yong MS32]